MAFTRDNWREVGIADLTNEELLARFEAASERGASSGPRTQRNRIHAALRRLELASGQQWNLLDVIGDADSLAELLRCDRALHADRQITRGTIANTRNALSAFIAWIPLPAEISRPQLRQILAEARMQVSTVRGTRLLSVVGRPTDTDDRPVPTAAEIGEVIEQLCKMSDPLALVAADLVATIYLTGIRIGAALALRRSDLVMMPDRRWYFLIREKSRNDRRPVLAQVRRREQFDKWEALAPESSLWQRQGLSLDYAVARRLLTEAAAAARMPSLQFHRLRHAFATDLAPSVGLRSTMLAGGWLGADVSQGYMHQRPES